MILSNATNISDIKLAGSSICGALQNSSQAIFWGYGSTTVSRILSGSIALYKYGAGTVILSSANSYTNGTFLADGVVSLSNSSGIASTGNITFLGGTLQYQSGILRDVSGRIKNSTSAVKVDLASGASQTWGANIDSSNIAGLTKTGAGTLTLSAANSLIGPLRVEAGSITVNSANTGITELRLKKGTGISSIATLRHASAVGNSPIYFEIESGNTLTDALIINNATTNSVMANPIYIDVTKGRAQLTASGIYSLTLSGPVTIIGTGASTTATTSGSVSNSYTLTLSSVTSAFVVGAVITGATSTATTIGSVSNSFIITVNSLPAYFVVGATITGSGITAAVSIVAINGLQLILSAQVTVSSGVVITASGIPFATSILAVNGNQLTLSNPVIVFAGTIITAGSAEVVYTNLQTSNPALNLTVSSAINAPNFLSNISLRGSVNQGIFTGSVYAPLGGMSFNGSNVWTMFANANNNYIRFSLSNTGTLKLGDNNALCTSALLAWTDGVTTKFDLNGKNQTLAGISSSTSNIANTSNALYNDSVTPCTLSLAALTTNRNFYGTLAGPFDLVMNSSGRTQGLFGKNTHTGATQIVNGTLSFDSIYTGAAGKLTAASMTSSQLSATFGSLPTSTETFKLLGGSTINSISSVSLTGATGLTGYYNSSTSTLGFVPAPTGASTDVPTVGSDTMIIPVSANPNGTQAGSSASVLIEYGTSPSLGLTSTPVTIGTGTTSVLSTHQLSALSSDTLYYYRARVSNVLWTVYSSTQSATTAPLGDQYFNNTFYLQTFDGLTEAQAYDNSNQAGYAALKDITSVYGAGTRTVSSSVAKSGKGANLPQPAVGYSTGINAQFPNTVVGRYWQPMIAWEFTIEAAIYVNPAVIGSVSLPFYGGFKVGSSLCTVYYRLDTANSAYLQISTVVDASGGPQNVQNVNIPLSGWYDIAITRDKNLTVRYFLNGSLIHTVQQSRYTGYDYSGELSETLGGVNTGYHTNPNNLLYVDDVRVSNVCRHTQNYTPVHPLPTVAKVGADPYLNNIIFLQDFSSTASGAILSDPLANLSSSGLSYTTSGMNMYRDQYSADFGPSLGTAYVVQDGNPTFAKRMVAWPSPDGAESRVYSVSSTARTTTATTTNSTVLSFSSAINYAAWQIGCVVLGPGIPFNTTIVDRSEDLSSVTLSTAVTVPSGTVLYGSMNKTPTINTTLSGNFTIEVSTKAAAYSFHNNARILSLFAASGEEIGSIGLVGSSGVPQLFLEGTNTTPALGSAALGLVWTDWAISWDGTSLRFFQNGKLIHTGSKTKTVASIGTPWIVPILDAIWVPAQNGQPGYYYSNMYTIIWSKLRITNACRYTADYNPVYPWPTT